MASRNHGLWFGVSCDADGCPQLTMLRAETDDAGDLYYYRALGWCKRYCRKGQLGPWWQAMATSVRWPGKWEELRDLWRKCRVVIGTLDEIFDWDKSNGWLIRRQEAAAKHMDDKRKAGRLSGQSRRRKAKQMRLALKQAQRGASAGIATEDACSKAKTLESRERDRER